jgi:hypothetical protein
MATRKTTGSIRELLGDGRSGQNLRHGKCNASRARMPRMSPGWLQNSSSQAPGHGSKNSRAMPWLRDPVHSQRRSRSRVPIMSNPCVTDLPVDHIGHPGGVHWLDGAHAHRRTSPDLTRPHVSALEISIDLVLSYWYIRINHIGIAAPGRASMVRSTAPQRMHSMVARDCPLRRGRGPCTSSGPVSLAVCQRTQSLRLILPGPRCDRSDSQRRRRCRCWRPSSA